MRVIIVLFIIFLYNTSSGKSSLGVLSVSHHSPQDDQKYRVLKEFAHSNASVWLVVREAGHVMGQPFQVELRVQCQSSSEEASKGEVPNNDANVMGFPVMDSFSVCDIKPDSVIINESQTAVAMMTKLVDMDDYNNQIASGDVDVKPRCAEATTVRTFSLDNLCQPNE